jgi:hypothetical protein
LAKESLEADMSFQIRDNLPDMDGRVYKSEIRLLIPFADNILLELKEIHGKSSPAIKKEDNPIEGRIIRKSIDHTTS